MMRMLSAGLVAVVAVNFLASTGLVADRPMEPTDRTGSNHASTAAYPKSVVSIKDSYTGMLYYVESNGRPLAAFDANGAVKWSIDVFESGHFTPSTGAAVVRDLKIREKVLWLTRGKHSCAKVDPGTGKVEFAGAD